MCYAGTVERNNASHSRFVYRIHICIYNNIMCVKFCDSRCTAAAAALSSDVKYLCATVGGARTVDQRLYVAVILTRTVCPTNNNRDNNSVLFTKKRIYEQIIARSGSVLRKGQRRAKAGAIYCLPSLWNNEQNDNIFDSGIHI